MTLQKIKIWTNRLILGYLMIGSIYYVSSFFILLKTGKDIVFSPIVGFLLALMGWPWMVYADLLHHQTLGVKIPTLLAIISMVAFMFFVIQKIVKGEVLQD